MSNIHGLRHVEGRSTVRGGRSALAHIRPAIAIVAIATLPVVAGALLSNARPASSPAGSTGSAPFVNRSLGPNEATASLERKWDSITRVSIARNGVQLRHDGHSVSISAAGAGAARWTRHAWGVDRPTAFGRESIVVAAPRTEEYLTVTRRLGPKIWSWRLDAGISKPQVEPDGSVSFSSHGSGAGVRVLPPVIYDAAGRSITPAGSHWALKRAASGTFLTLALDDRSLPAPYVIDPIAVVGSPGQTGSTKTGSPLTITKPTGVATGNLMVATVSLRDATATLTAPAGWTLLTSVASSGNTTKQYVFTKVATAGEAASYTFSWAGGSGATDSSGVILAYSGIWAGAGSNVDTSTTSTANASTTAATTAGTATYAQDMILALYGTAGASSFTTPAGMTVRGTVTSQSGSPATRSSTGSFDVIQAASGAVAAKSSTITNRDNTAVMVAIRPAAASASAALSTLVASPTSVAADGSTTSTVTATIKDTNGNPLVGKTVTLAKGSGSSTIATVSASRARRVSRPSR